MHVTKAKPSRSDTFIAAAIQQRLYRPDPETGRITGRRGKSLALPVDREGYRQVTLRVDGQQATVRAHRMIAAYAWGLEAIVGREVGHRNGDPSDNRVTNLWIPDSQSDHYRHDDAVKPKARVGAPVKTEWLPCVRCDDPDGPPFHGRKSPARVTGQMFGIEGDLCWRCYRTLYERKRRARSRALAAQGVEL